MTREFRFEYIRDVVFEQDDTVARTEGPYDSSGGYSPVTVVFRAKDDGKYYAFEYGHNSQHGIYSCFEEYSDDTVVSLTEVEKQEVTTTKWVPVSEGSKG